MSDPQTDAKMIPMLLDRLERIPADSPLAHRASGVRGALMKLFERMEMGETIEASSLQNNTSIGFEILNAAAKARS